MKDLIELVAAVIGLAGLAYRLGKVEEKIFDAVQELRSDLNVHLKEYEIRKDWVDYMIHALNEKISHKFDRLREEIKFKREG